MANILDTIKSGGLTAILSAVKLLAPKEFSDLIDKIQADVEGGITLDEALATFTSAVRAIETFTGPEWDAALESVIETVNSMVKTVTLIITATEKK